MSYDDGKQPMTNESTYFKPNRPSVCDRVPPPPVDIKCCKNCLHFDPRTHFCRLNPPTPMLFNGPNGEQSVSSKFPVITDDRRDYCSHHKHCGKPAFNM